MNKLAAPTLIAPTLEEWRAMTPDERERLLIQFNDALSDPCSAMSEGRPHKKAKDRALDVLGRHFSAVGRVVYLAEEMAVLYPGEPVFTPDVLAVVDVPQPEDDERLAWVVADEPKGLDLVLEVLHRGNRKKDLEDNRERYANLRIPEYFVYDLARQQIHGYRLTETGPPYQRIEPQAGRVTSRVLAIDLAIVHGTLQFFTGESELAGTPELVDRLQSMVNELGAKAEQAAAQADHATAQADQALTAGRAEGLRVAVRDACELLAIELTPEQERALSAMTIAELDALRERIKRDRRWEDVSPA